MKTSLLFKIKAIAIVLSLTALPALSQNFMQKARFAIENGNQQIALQILENSGDSLYLPDNENAFLWYANILFNELNWEKLSQLNHLPSEISYVTEFAKFLNQFPKQSITFKGDSVEIKFKRSITGTPKIPVTINGVETMFWFDTGAGITLLSDKTAQKSKVVISEKDLIEIESANGSKFFAPSVFIEDCNFQGVSLKNHYGTVLPKHDLQFKMLGIPIVTIKGIIGWPFFQNFNVTINYKRNVLIIKPPTEKRKEVNFFWMEMPIVKCLDEDQKSALYAYDTGAGSSCLFINYANRTSKKGKKKKMRYGSAGGVKKIEVTKYNNHEIEVSGKKIKFFMPVTIGIEGIFHGFVLDGLLGNIELKTYTINFDMNAGYFEAK